MSGVLTAVFTTTPQSPPPTSYGISINSSDLNGTAISGMNVVVRVDGNDIVNGTTPVTFPDLEPHVQYQVFVYSSGDYYFREFSNGGLNDYATVEFNSTGSTTVTDDALYQHVPASQAAYLNVEAELPNGTLLGTVVDNVAQTPGMWFTVTPSGSDTPFTGAYTGASNLPFVLLNNETYTITMTISYQSYHFAHWQDNNNTSPIRVVDLNGNLTLIAIYTTA